MPAGADEAVVCDQCHNLFFEKDSHLLKIAPEMEDYRELFGATFRSVVDEFICLSLWLICALRAMYMITRFFRV